MAKKKSVFSLSPKKTKSNIKRKIAKTTGIPTTKQGRERKAKGLLGNLFK